MAERAYFDKAAVRPQTKRKIDVLALFYGDKGKVVNYLESLINAEWKKAEAEGKVNDHMLAEPAELPS